MSLLYSLLLHLRLLPDMPTSKLILIGMAREEQAYLVESSFTSRQPHPGYTFVALLSFCFGSCLCSASNTGSKTSCVGHSSQAYTQCTVCKPFVTVCIHTNIHTSSCTLVAMSGAAWSCWRELSAGARQSPGPRAW